MRAIARAALLTLAVLAVDQGTKALVRSGIERGDEDPILPLIKLVHTRNSGIAFGAFAGGGAIVAVLVALALVALVAFFVTHLDRRGAWIPVGLLMGGAVGNVIDRVRDGAVTDFLKVPAWPAFNIADMAITVGVLALLLVVERGEDGPPDRA